MTFLRLIWAGVMALGLFFVGTGVEGRQLTDVSVMLEFFANPDHAPLYIAQEKGFFAQEGLDVEIREPGDPSQVPFLVASGAVDIGLTSMFNHLILRATEDIDNIAVGALLMEPLGALIAIKEHGIEEITDLKGGKIGFSVEPTEPATYSTMLRNAGLDPENDVQFIKLDFLSLMPALLAGRVDAIGGFRNFEPVKVELEGLTPAVFKQEDYGAPESYQILFITRRDLIGEKPEAIRGLLNGVAKGVLFVLAHPQASKELFFQALPDLRDELNTQAYDRTVSIFAGAPCHNDPARWRNAQNFLYEQEIIPQTLPLDELFLDQFLPEGCR